MCGRIAADVTINSDKKGINWIEYSVKVFNIHLHFLSEIDKSQPGIIIKG